MRRKPLPPGSKHDRRISGSPLDSDSFPLVPVKDSFAWSPSPELHHEVTIHENAGQQHIFDSAHRESNAGFKFFNRDGQYSRLTHSADQHHGHTSTQKSPGVSQKTLSSELKPQTTPRMWNPVWLHPLVLCCFVVLFLALLAGLLILWHFAVLQNGISTSITDNHYAWTYGPTALLVVIGLAWKQVDYNCRILAPWRHLRVGLSPAHSSLLLDYISPILPHALIVAATEGDWAVLASGLGILILRIVIIFSTALLVLTPTTVSRTVDDAVVNSKFTGTNYTVGPDVKDAEVMRYYGIQEHGMNYLYGTSETVAYETLDLGSVMHNATVTTTVNGIFPHFDCEVVEPEIVNFTWENDGEYPYEDKLKLNMTMTPEKCPGVLITFPNYCQPTEDGCPHGHHIYSDEGFYMPGFFNPNVIHDELDPCGNLYRVSITEFFFERIDGPPINTSAAWNVTLSNTTGIVCTIRYTVDTVNVTVNAIQPTSPGNVNVSGPIDRVMDVLPGFSYTNFTTDFQNEDSIYGLQQPLNAPNISGYAKLFAVLAGGSASALLDPEVLKSTAEKAFEGVGVQLANQYLRHTDSRQIIAKAVFQESRLQIRVVSVWAMGTGFTLLAFLALVVLIWRPQDVVSHDPASIAAYAAILAGSRSLQGCLEGAGNLSDAQMKQQLSSTIASSQVTMSDVSPIFTIEAVSQERNYHTQADNLTGPIIWWRPISTMPWFMILVILLPASIIVSLEILQRRSNAGNGLLDISSKSLVDHSLPSILASLVMMLTAIMYDAIDFAAATLAPYQALVRGSAAAQHVVVGGLSGDLPLWSILEAFRSHLGTAKASLVAAVVGSFLTIIASGLYTIENVPSASEVHIMAADRFAPVFNISTDGGAGALFNLIEHNNASYPPWTYDELAFPHIATSGLGEDAQEQLRNSEAVTFQAKLPATRASLNCTLVPRDTMVRQLSYYKDTSCPSTTVTFNVSLPDSCPRFLDADNNATTDIQFSYNAQFACSQPDLLQASRGAVLSSVNGIYLGDQGTTLGAASNPPGCPSLAFIYGYWVVNETSTANITAMTCIQGLEEVNADALFEVSGESMQVKSPPITDEGSVQWLTSFNSTYWFTRYAYFDGFNENGSLPDYFYQAINYGPDGIPPDELAGPANVNRFINATQHMYRRWMAQLISNTMRRDLNSSETVSGPKHTATVTDIPRQRLKQNATSKLILQICLAVMLACGVFVYAWRDMSHVLPHSPWSIAGLMSLLAGAEMVERKIVPPGAEFMNNKELARVFEGYVFSLGWWNVGAGPEHASERKRFGIDIGKADASAGRRRWLR